MNQLTVFDFIALEPEVDLLVDWAINTDSTIRHHIKNGQIKLDNFKSFAAKLKRIFCYRGHASDYIYVHFNHWSDKKIHFKINGYQEKIISFEHFCKEVWKRVKNV